ncbi:LOW QUALITY PROTEIN: hypothetical protein QYF61_016136 [Mycteria americana]|uniref:Endonuclease/exonuclease/phosphatase domain-containing protein n=1 Tax=Mycteria americana TaxID=33587 RepID=A0AAN7NBG5_MYCAM|nr:LOW QUALITY PROTEIN: hypothetical protein QYF61_016136 [Mycteria americana]
MGNKQEELEAIVHQENYDMVTITETWWDDSHSWSAAMDGYKLFGRDRRSRRGGGVALYVRECLDSLELNDGDDRVECLWVRIRGKANKADIVVGVCYRPPNQDEETDELFYKQLGEASQSLALFLVGDFNLPDVCWKYNTAERKQSRRFLERVADNFLTQLVSEPTREGAPLDLLFTNREGLVSRVMVGVCLGQSNHEMIEFLIRGEAARGVSKTATLDFQRADFGLFRRLVDRVPWEAALMGKGVQEGWRFFKEEVLKAQEQAVPRCRKMSRRGRRLAWLNRELWLELRKKRRVYDLWKKGRATQEDYKGVARLCREKIRRAKAELELNLAAAVKDNKKHFFKYISSKRRAKENLQPLVDGGGNTVTKDEEKAEVLNAYFASVFNSRANCSLGTQPLELEDRDRDQNGAPIIQGEMVSDLLHHLDTHKSMGPDEIHPRVLKELADVLTKTLSIIYQQSWLTGEVPVDWRLANVMPIFKKGQKEDPGNYRLSSSPTINLTLPTPPLHHVPQHLIQVSFKYFQGWRLNHFPGQPVPMLDNPFSEVKFPNIQSKPPLAQLEAISSCPVTCYLGEETDPHLPTTSFQVVVESKKVLPQPPFLQAKQPQFPQLLLIRLTLHQLRCPSLHTLQHLNVSLVVRGPKLNTVFEVRPHQCRVQGHDHFPSPAGHAIFDTSQDAIGFLGHLGTLLAHIQLAIDQHPQVLFCLAAFQPLFPKPVALHGVAVAQVQDLALGLVEPHTIDLGPSIQPVQVPLQSLPTLKQINTPTQLGVICKLTEGALDPLVQIIDKDVKQNWPQHRALGNTACDRPPTGFNSIHHHSLGPAIQPVLYPVKSTPIQAMSSQFLQENAVGNGEVFQPSDHFCGPPLDLLQQVHVCLVLRTPELDAVLQLFIHQYPQVLLHRAALNPLIPQPVLILGVAPTQVQDLALGLIEPHEVHTGPLLQLVQVPLNGIPSLRHVNHTTQLGVICKFAEGVLDPTMSLM